MRIIATAILLLAISSVNVLAQSSAQSSVGSIDYLPTRGFPPVLVIDSLRFEEPSRDGILDAGEESFLHVFVTNRGRGEAEQAILEFSEGVSLENLTVQESDQVRVAPGASAMMTAKVVGQENLEEGLLEIALMAKDLASVAESLPVEVSIETRPFYPPSLSLSEEYDLYDGKSDYAFGNDNGIMEPLESVQLTLVVQNTGRGAANDVKASINLPPGVTLSSEKALFELGRLGPGEWQTITLGIWAGRSLEAEKFPVSVALSEATGSFGAEDSVELQLNSAISSVRRIRIASQQADESPTEPSGIPALGSDLLANLPVSGIDNERAVAVVIGISDYQDDQIPDVAYATRDANLVREYLVKVLGFREENILPRNPDAMITAGYLKTLIRNRLPNYLRDGSDVFFFYSGHGAPNVTTGEGFLVPADADPNYVTADNAYSLDELYSDLAELNSRGSLTVAIDACFSGWSGSGEMLIRNASPLMTGLELQVDNPLLTRNDTVILTASGATEVANWYESKRHGMFTYFLIKGLLGDADFNADNLVTAQEIEAFLTDRNHGVPYWSTREYNRRQSPVVIAADQTRTIAPVTNQK